jgi:hypothetical protein
MLRHVTSAMLLAIAFNAGAAQSMAGAPGPLQKGTTVRVWAPTKSIDARRGWVDNRRGDTIDVKFPAADAHLETDERWEVVTLASADVERIEIQRQGRWWLVDFTNAAPQLVEESAPGLALDPGSPVRVWTRDRQLRGAQAAMVLSARDTLELDFGRPGTSRQLRRLALDDVTRLEVPARGFTYGKGALRGWGFGLTTGAAIALITGRCSDASCAGIPHTFVPYMITGGVSGIGVGLLASWWSQHRWHSVDLR